MPTRKRSGGGGRAGAHEASFTVEFPDGRLGRRRMAAVEAALSPEISGGAPDAPGAAGDRVTMRRLPGGRGLEVRLRSSTLPSLRAALNAHMRMAALAQDVAAVAAADGVAPVAAGEAAEEE